MQKNFGVDTEFMWHDLPINSKTKQLLQTCVYQKFDPLVESAKVASVDTVFAEVCATFC